MPLDINYFKAIQHAMGQTSENSVKIQQAGASLSVSLKKSIGYKPLATRNGLPQPVVITTGKGGYVKNGRKSTIIALPRDTLCSGDIIESDGNHWLIMERNSTNPVQVTASAWICNQKFRFQNGTSTVIEKYGILDDGNYANSGDKQIQTIANKFKMFLPYDKETEKLFLNKRLATNKSYDKDGKQIITAYEIKALDPVSQSYGKGAHLLVLEVESSVYNATVDNIAELICDYIPPSDTSGGGTTALLPCSINGRRSVRTGTSCTYTSSFYMADGVTIDPNIIAVWDMSPNIQGITGVANGNSFTTTIANKDALIGEVITLTLKDTGKLYNVATIKTEVI